MSLVTQICLVAIWFCVTVLLFEKIKPSKLRVQTTGWLRVFMTLAAAFFSSLWPALLIGRLVYLGVRKLQNNQ